MTEHCKNITLFLKEAERQLTDKESESNQVLDAMLNALERDEMPCQTQERLRNEHTTDEQDDDDTETPDNSPGDSQETETESESAPVNMMEVMDEIPPSDQVMTPEMKAARAALSRAFFLDKAGPVIRPELGLAANYGQSRRDFWEAVDDYITLSITGKYPLATWTARRLHKKYWKS